MVKLWSLWKYSLKSKIYAAIHSFIQIVGLESFPGQFWLWDLMFDTTYLDTPALFLFLVKCNLTSCLTVLHCATHSVEVNTIAIILLWRLKISSFILWLGMVKRPFTPACITEHALNFYWTWRHFISRGLSLSALMVRLYGQKHLPNESNVMFLFSPHVLRSPLNIYPTTLPLNV